MATEEPKKKTSGKTIKIFIILVVLAIIGSGAFYFCYWLRTPQHSLDLIKQAMEQHDDATFEKQVDVSRIADDMVSAMIDVTVMNGEETGLFKDNFVAMIKGATLPAFNSQIRNYVQTGAFQPWEGKSDGFVIAGAAIDRTGFKDLSYTGVSNVNRHNATAEVTCKIYDKKLQKEFPLRITMNRLEDGTWRVVNLNGLPEFVKTRDAVVVEKLLVLNKPIKEEIGTKVRVVKDGSKPFRIQKITENESGIPAYALRAEFSFELLAPQVQRVKGEVLVYDEGGKQIFAGEFDSKAIDLSANGQKIWGYSNSWHLNGQDPTDKLMITTDMKNTTQDVLFTEVDMADGTVIKYLTTMPDSK